MILGTAFFSGWVIYNAGGLNNITESIYTMFNKGGPLGIKPDEILAFTPSRAKDISFSLLLVFGLQWLFQMNSSTLIEFWVNLRSLDQQKRESFPKLREFS